MLELEPTDDHLALPRRRVAGVTVARVGLLGAWFLASLLIARVLGPAALGLYALCLTAIQLVTDCIADPLEAGVMREVPLHLRNGERETALAVIRAAFWVRSGIGLLALTVTAAVPWVVSRLIFDHPSYPHLAELTALGVLSDLLLRAALGYLQVSERFRSFLLVDGVWQLSRVLLVVALAATHRLSMDAAVAVYALCPYLAFGVALMVIPADLRRPALPAARQVRELLHYSKWMAIALAMGSLSERLDVFLLNYFHGSAPVGLYAAALTLAMIPDRLNGIVQTAIAPRIAPAHAAGQFAQLQRQYLSVALPCTAVAAMVALVAGRWIVRALLSARFAGSVLPFELLVLGTLFHAAVMPLPAALLNFVAPKKVAAMTALGLVLVVVGGLILIPPFGAVGAAAVMLSVRLLIDGIALLLVRSITAAPTGAG